MGADVYVSVVNNSMNPDKLTIFVFARRKYHGF